MRQTSCEGRSHVVLIFYALTKAISRNVSLAAALRILVQQSDYKRVLRQI